MDFFAAETLPFAVALCVTAGIAIIEFVGLVSGFSTSEPIDAALPDFDAPDGDVSALGPLSHALSWLNFGKVPALVIIVVFAASFGLIGLVGQDVLRRSFGFALSPWLMSIPALIGAVFATRWGGRLLARIMPRDESDAVSTAGFVGRIATVIRGVARPGEPAEAKLKDIRGKTHYLLIEPDEAGQEFGQGSKVVIIRQEGSVYRAITKLKPTDS